MTTPTDRAADAEAVRAMMLGIFIGTIARPDFPIKIAEMEQETDREGIVQSMLVTTESGLILRVRVETPRSPDGT